MLKWPYIKCPHVEIEKSQKNMILGKTLNMVIGCLLNYFSAKHTISEYFDYSNITNISIIYAQAVSGGHMLITHKSDYYFPQLFLMFFNFDMRKL